MRYLPEALKRKNPEIIRAFEKNIRLSVKGHHKFRKKCHR